MKICVAEMTAGGGAMEFCVSFPREEEEMKSELFLSRCFLFL